MGAAVTSAIKEICSISNDDEQVPELSYKEIGKKRHCWNERDVQSMFATVVEQMVNPFEGSDVKELQNIATGVIAPAEVAQGILEEKKIDRKLWKATLRIDLCQTRQEYLLHWKRLAEKHLHLYGNEYLKQKEIRSPQSMQIVHFSVVFYHCKYKNIELEGGP